MQSPFTILLHSSKTMRSPDKGKADLRVPLLLSEATQLNAHLKTLTADQLKKVMHISTPLADKTHDLIANWSTAKSLQSLAIDSFVGDIYSGLRAEELSTDDRDYADKTLRILSGLYGVIRPYDGICPYRLEMAYRLPGFTDLYTFWNNKIARCLPNEGPVVNVSSVEYTKVILPFIDPARVITPKFLTIDPKTHKPVFVVVHAKIARGAFARWLITSRTTNIAEFSKFSDIGYIHDPSLSTPVEPVFICQTFEGLGLSMRLVK